MTKAEIEGEIWKISATQHGVVSRPQLLRAGVPPHVVDRLLRSGRLRPIHHGVYLAAPLIGPRTRGRAAVLSCGDRAFVSHRSAAAMWSLLPEVASGLVDVILLGGKRARRQGVRAHFTTRLPADEVTTLDGIRLTSPARTLLDLAGSEDRRTLERALANALRQGCATRAQLRLVLERYPRRRGTGRLRALLQEGDQPALTRSEAEERFLALIRRARLPKPETNVSIGAYEVDFFWRAARFVAEIDGFAFHASEEKFESDRRRDGELTASGIRVMRVTWSQLTKEREALVARLSAALARTSQA